MNSKEHEERLGRDKMLPLVLRMSLPGVAAQLINLLYSLVDRVYIGHIPTIGTEALAGVGVTSSVIILITAFSTIVGIGGAPLAAIALGKGDRRRAEYFLGNGAVLLSIFTVFTALITYIFMEPILLSTGASEATLPYAEAYLHTYLGGTLFVMISTGLSTFINVQGRPAIAMWAVVVGAVLNITLDPIFIFTLDMGVRGAALASVISQGVSASIILWFLLSKRASLRLKHKYMRLNREIIITTIALGFSPFIMSSTEALVGFVLNGSLKHFGDIHISAMTIIQSALLCSSVPMSGFAQGFMPIVGYNYGHEETERVKECFKIALVIMAGFNFLLILSIILFPTAIASIFTSDVELIELLREVMPVFFAGMLFFGIQRTCQTMFIALGEAKISICIAILRKVILLVPLALILPRWWGVMGVYRAEAISDITAAICCATIFYFAFPRILKRIK